METARFCTFFVKGKACGQKVGSNATDNICSHCRGIIRQRNYRNVSKIKKATQVYYYSKEETLTELPEYIALREQEREWEDACGRPFDRKEFPIGRCIHVQVDLNFIFLNKKFIS